MFFTDFRQGAKLALNQKDVRRLARFCALGSTANRRVQPVRLKTRNVRSPNSDRIPRSREFIARARASALALRFHGSDRPSEAIEASQRGWILLVNLQLYARTALTSLPFEKRRDCSLDLVARTVSPVAPDSLSKRSSFASSTGT